MRSGTAISPESQDELRKHLATTVDGLIISSGEDEG